MLSRFASRALKQLRQTQMVAGRAYSTEVSYEFTPCKYHKFEGDPVGTTGSLEKDQAIDYLRKMMVIRRMETAAGELYRGKKIRGFCHLYSGQEAVACGMNAAMSPDDGVISAYRVHGWAYLLGATVQEVIGELTGRECGMSLGKGGSMHMYGENFYGGNGIVGAQVPIGAGIALANKYLDNKTVSVALYGDGAANQGQVFEAYNMAKLWDLPAIFVCENNHYGMGTSSERSSANNKYYTRGDYIPGIHVDAMDFVAVKEATAWAREYALNEGPIVMEMSTYRYHGHSMSDPDTTYRTREEKEDTRKNRDPISLLSQKVAEQGWMDAAEIKAMEKEVRKQVKAETDAALACPEPPIEMLGTHVYSGEYPPMLRGCDQTIQIPNL